MDVTANHGFDVLVCADQFLKLIAVAYADLIYPGQVFDIDRDASSSEIDAAVTHAKTRGAWSVGTVEVSDEAYLAQ